MTEVGPDGLTALEELDDAIHSMAQPLTALLFAVEMAHMQPQTEQARQSIASARTEARRAAEMLEQVRECARRVREDMVACKRP